MIMVKYYDKEEREAIGELIRSVEKGKHKGQYEVKPINRKHKVKINRDDMIDVWLPEEEEK